jgi:hypothetical protein
VKVTSYLDLMPRLRVCGNITTLRISLSDFIVGIPYVLMKKVFIMYFVSKTIINFYKEFENMPHRANSGVKCQV